MKRKMNYVPMLLLACLLSACGGDSTPDPDPNPSPTPTPEPTPDPVELVISFEQPETFYLGQVKEVDYALPKTQPTTIEAKDVPAEWDVEVVTRENKIKISCSENYPVGGKDGKATLVLKASSGESKDAIMNLSSTDNQLYNEQVQEATEWGEGNGRRGSPWLISNVGLLKRLVNDVANGESYADKFFKLTMNVQVEAEWMPIGISGENCFSGHFDGNGMTVGGELKSALYPSFGVFGVIANGGDITNLTIRADVTNQYAGNNGSNTGGVVGYANTASGSIAGCKITGTISGGNASGNNQVNVGGIAGYNGYYTISDREVIGSTITSEKTTNNANADQTSGIAEVNWYGTIIQCAVSDSEIIDGNKPVNYTGGIVGYHLKIR